MPHQTAPLDTSRHRRLFEILCHAERAAQTSARLAIAHRLVDEAVGLELRQTAARSLDPIPLTRRKQAWDVMCRLVQRHQKKEAASSSTVITPMIAPFDGSVMGIDTRL